MFVAGLNFYTVCVTESETGMLELWSSHFEPEISDSPGNFQQNHKVIYGSREAIEADTLV